MNSLLAWYKDTKVYLNYTEDMLVFDGSNFVDPAKAKYVMLIAMPQVSFLSPTAVAYDQGLVYQALSMTNKWLCKVLGAGPTETGDPDVVEVADPLDGECLCFITCVGTNLSYVVVSQDTSEPPEEDEDPGDGGNGSVGQGN